MRRARGKSRREPTIALINIVFLMLVFFMVAGTLAQPLDKALTLVRTADLQGAPPADGLVVHTDGKLAYRGQAIASAQAFMDAQPKEALAVIRLIPDRDLPASELVAISSVLRAAGAGRIVLVTERGLQ